MHLIRIHRYLVMYYRRLSSGCKKNLELQPFFEISRTYVSGKRKKKRFFRVRSLSDGPRRTEISCVSPAQLPFESGIIKV